MKKVIRLTENDLLKIVKRVIKESIPPFNNYSETELETHKKNAINCIYNRNFTPYGSSKKAESYCSTTPTKEIINLVLSIATRAESDERKNKMHQDTNIQNLAKDLLKRYSIPDLVTVDEWLKKTPNKMYYDEKMDIELEGLPWNKAEDLQQLKAKHGWNDKVLDILSYIDPRWY